MRPHQLTLFDAHILRGIRQLRMTLALPRRDPRIRLWQERRGNGFGSR